RHTKEAPMAEGGAGGGEHPVELTGLEVVADLAEDDEVERAGRPLVRDGHPLDLDLVEPGGPLAGRGEGHLEDVGREQPVASPGEQAGEHPDRAARLEPATEPGAGQRGER